MKYSISSFAILLCVISILGSCKTKKPVVTEPLSGEPLYFLSKGPCFGKCPVYTLTIYNDGIAEYKGVNFTKLLGTYRKSITKEQMTELDALFSTSDFDGYESNYESLLPDLQLVKVGYATGDSIRIVMGKEERPTELMTLQYALENIVNEGGWELIEALQMVGEEEPIISDDGSLDKSKFVIRHKPGTQVPQWFTSMRETYGLRLIDKVALDEGNGWLVTYATKNHTPEDMMEVLKADKAILSADFAKAN